MHPRKVNCVRAVGKVIAVKQKGTFPLLITRSPRAEHIATPWLAATREPEAQPRLMRTHSSDWLDLLVVSRWKRQRVALQCRVEYSVCTSVLQRVSGRLHGKDMPVCLCACVRVCTCARAKLLRIFCSGPGIIVHYS